MTSIQKYYMRSINDSRALLLALLGAVLLAIIGCGGPNQVAGGAQRLAYADLTGKERQAAFSSLTKGPAVVHFKKGDRVPVRVTLDSSLAQVQASELVLVVERDFYLLLDGDGPPRLSEDGVDFESKAKNYFLFGFNVPKEGEAGMVLQIGIRPERSQGAPDQ